MRGKIIALSLGLAASAPGLGAPAPDPRGEPVVPTGTRIPRWEMPVLESKAEAIRTLRSYSACLALKAKEAPLLLRTLPESADQGPILDKLLARRGCHFEAQLRFPVYLLRGAIAEALYRARAPASGATLMPAQPPETYEQFTVRMTASDRKPRDQEGKQMLLARWLAYCAAHENPAGGAALLYTDATTPSEIDALRALRPTLERCLFRGTSVNMDALAVRSLLAEALYQRQLAIARP